MRRLSDAQHLARALERAYEMRDTFEKVWEEQKAAAPVTVEDMVAASSVRESIGGMISYYQRELRSIARKGGHGHRVQGARELTPCTTEFSDGVRVGGSPASVA